MTPMVRKQILLDHELEASIEQLSAEIGISQGELIRRTLRDALLGEAAKRRSAHERLMAMIHEWQRLHPVDPDADKGQHDRGWTREELYEDDEGNPWGFRTGSARGHQRADLPVGREGPEEERDRDEVDV